YVFFDTNLVTDTYPPLSFIGQNSFKSGYFAGKLLSYLVSKEETVLSLSLHTVKPPDNHVNYIQREEGLSSFLKEKNSFKLRSLHFNSFEKTNGLEKELLDILKNDPSIKVIFVTNSRAHQAAEILERNSIQHLKMIGYDLIGQNIDYLNKGYIDFL